MKTGTDVTLSCSISGISAAAAVLWKKSGTPDLSNSIAGHTVAAGNFGSEAQVSTLTLTAAVNIADTTFTCDVTPSGGTAQSTEVTLNVFGMFIETFFILKINFKVDFYFITCFSWSLEITRCPFLFKYFQLYFYQTHK